MRRAALVAIVHLVTSCVALDEDETAYKEYKKWVREQKLKLKRDPIPGAKVELVKVTTVY